MDRLRQQLENLSRKWIHQGLASREQLIKEAHQLIRWKMDHGVQGLWSVAPSLMTATLDDGIGQGIDIINLFARVLGLAVTPLGLMQRPATIVDACRRQGPEFLGLTVVQLDSEEDLAHVGHNLPPATRLIAGGPAFRHDPELATRCAVHYVAANVAYFIDFFLKIQF